MTPRLLRACIVGACTLVLGFVHSFSAVAQEPYSVSLAQLSLQAGDLANRFSVWEAHTTKVSEVALAEPASMRVFLEHGLQQSYVTRLVAKHPGLKTLPADSISDGLDEYRTVAGARWSYQHVLAMWGWKTARVSTGTIAPAHVGDRGLVYQGHGGNAGYATVLFQRGRFVVVVKLRGAQTDAAKADGVARVIDKKLSKLK